MTAEQKERLKPILRRLRATNSNEGISLAGWEAELLVAYINELKGAAKRNENGVV